MTHLVLTTVLLASIAATSPRNVEVKLLDGTARQGTLVGITAQQLTLEHQQQSTVIPIANVATVRTQASEAPPDRRGPATISLVDGSRLAAESYEVQGGQATVKMAGGQQVHVSSRLIAAVRFTDAAAGSEGLEDTWSQIAATKSAADLLVVRKKKSLDYLEGVVGNVGPERVEFKHDKDALNVNRTKIEGIIYYRAASDDLTPAICQVEVAGSQVPASELALSEGKLTVKTPAGVELTFGLEEVVALDFSSGKIQYLSDLEPESVTFAPYLSLAQPLDSLTKFYRPRRDRGFEHEGLQLEGKKYTKGVCLSSRTSVVYRLGGKFREFRSVVGIEDTVRTAGNVHLEIVGDGRVLWQDDIHGRDAAKQIVVDLSGVKRLEIRVGYGKDLDLADQVALCDARMIK